MKKMKTNKSIILFILLLFTETTWAQEKVSEFPVHFRVNRTVIDSAYMGNRTNLKSIADYIKEVTSNPNITIKHITFGGAASPEGSYQLNRRLAKERANTLRRLVRSLYPFPDSIISINDHYIQWDSLKQMAGNDSLDSLDAVISILSDDAKLVKYHSNELIDQRVLELQRANNGKTWKKIYHKFFPSMRNAYATFVAITENTPPGRPKTFCRTAMGHMKPVRSL